MPRCSNSSANSTRSREPARPRRVLVHGVEGFRVVCNCDTNPGAAHRSFTAPEPFPLLVLGPFDLRVMLAVAGELSPFTASHLRAPGLNNIKRALVCRDDHEAGCDRPAE